MSHFRKSLIFTFTIKAICEREDYKQAHKYCNRPLRGHPAPGLYDIWLKMKVTVCV